MENFLTKALILIGTWLVIFIAAKIDRKRGHYTRYERKLRKKWESEQQENQTFRQASRPLTQQSFEEWKAARKDTRGRD